MRHLTIWERLFLRFDPQISPSTPNFMPKKYQMIPRSEIPEPRIYLVRKFLKLAKRDLPGLNRYYLIPVPAQLFRGENISEKKAVKY